MWRTINWISRLLPLTASHGRFLTWLLHMVASSHGRSLEQVAIKIIRGILWTVLHLEMFIYNLSICPDPWRDLWPNP